MMASVDFTLPSNNAVIFQFLKEGRDRSFDHDHRGNSE
jgi:hypothetical protein